jgi:hypothetical protein
MGRGSEISLAASLGAVLPNFLFHGGTGKISFLTSENGKKSTDFMGYLESFALF